MDVVDGAPYDRTVRQGRAAPDPVVVWSAMHFSNWAHVSKVKGSPAVGSCWNISARLEA